MMRSAQSCLTRFRPSAPLCRLARHSTVAGTEVAQFNLYNPTEEHAALRSMLREFVESEVDPQALEYNRKEQFNLPLFRKLGDLGLLGITVEPEYGGSGMDAVAAVIVHEELSASDPAFCLSYLAHSMLFVNNLARNGTHEQKLKYLPAACTGESICGMGMSEPGAGTDVMSMGTSAVLGEDGTYTLNGAKMWITNGTADGVSTGDVFLVYARTSEGNSGLTSFLVEKGMPGFTLGQKIEDKCGMRASMTAELVFDNVKVPAANIVGTLGGATLCMMRNLEIERITLAAMSLGIARRSIEVMSNYSQQRKAFGKAIGEFGQIQKMISESYAEFMAGRAYTYSVAGKLDLDVSYTATPTTYILPPISYLPPPTFHLLYPTSCLLLLS
mmetsp:Transcript_11164/g.24387  ORF Transcript_11164/g.24387 Transcript_11164/m.24387 type:complete len:386 (-) Transcript_11164:85-1242(-)